MSTTSSQWIITTGSGLFNSAGHRVELSTGDVTGLVRELRQLPASVEAWWTPHTYNGDIRKQVLFEQTIGVAIDCDYYPDGDHGKAEEHMAVPPMLAAELRNKALDLKLPGNWFHSTPRGFRTFSIFDSPCLSAEQFKIAASGAGELMWAALSGLGLWREEDEDPKGFLIDRRFLYDTARLMYTPNSIVGDVQRSAEIVVMRQTPFTVDELKAHAPAPIPTTVLAPPTPAAPAKYKPRANVAKTFSDECDIYNARNAREFPKMGSHCPICGSDDGFKALKDNPGRWCCFSSKHTSGGKLGGGPGEARHFHGDVVDLDSAVQGTDPRAFLISLGQWREAKPKVLADNPSIEQPEDMEFGIDSLIADAVKAEEKARAQGKTTASRVTRQTGTGSVLSSVHGSGGASGSGSGAATPPPQPKPELVINTQVHLFVEKVDKLLAMFGEKYYQRDGRVIRLDGRRQRTRKGPAMTITGATTNGLVPAITKIANVIKYNKDGDKVGMVPPNEYIKSFLEQGEWNDLDHLWFVFDAPFLGADGVAVNRPGYDRQSGCYYNITSDPVYINPQPTQMDAMVQKDLIMGLVAEFPFEGGLNGASAAGWLAGLLTPLCRPAYNGSSPMFAMDANLQGSGKSYLCDIIHIIASGKPFRRSMLAANQDEQRKSITTMVDAGTLMVLYDNQHGEVGGSALEAVLTSREWSDRRLGGNSHINGEVAMSFYVSGNNLKFSDDMIRRIVWVRLNSDSENPEDRGGFKIDRILEHAEKDRHVYLGAALTIMEAYVKAGKPWPAGVKASGGYEAWSDLIRGAVMWVGMPDPLGNRTKLKDQSGTAKATMASLLHWWSERGSEWRLSSAGFIAKLSAMLNGTETEKETAREAVDMLSSLTHQRDNGLPSPAKLSSVLARHKMAPMGGLALVQRKAGHTKLVTWSVVTVDEMKQLKQDGEL